MYSYRMKDILCTASVFMLKCVDVACTHWRAKCMLIANNPISQKSIDQSWKPLLALCCHSNQSWIVERSGNLSFLSVEGVFDFPEFSHFLPPFEFWMGSFWTVSCDIDTVFSIRSIVQTIEFEEIDISHLRLRGRGEVWEDMTDATPNNSLESSYTPTRSITSLPLRLFVGEAYLTLMIHNSQRSIYVGGEYLFTLAANGNLKWAQTIQRAMKVCVVPAAVSPEGTTSNWKNAPLAISLVRYCSVKCQRVHRPTHKKECKKRAAELRDEILFKQPESSHRGDCPICCLPLPNDKKTNGIMSCCGKIICIGYAHANYKREFEWKLETKCAFCRHPVLYQNRRQKSKIIAWKESRRMIQLQWMNWEQITAMKGITKAPLDILPRQRNWAKWRWCLVT